MIGSETSQKERPKVMGKRSILSDEALEKANKKMSMIATDVVTNLENKTRRWGRLLVQSDTKKSVTNRFGPVSPLFFYPLVKGFVESKDDQVIWGGDHGGRFLSHLLFALSTFVDNAGHHPSAVVLGTHLFELAWSFHGADNPQVRLASLVAVATCLGHLREEYLIRIIFESEQLPMYLHHAKERDSNEHCRRLASSILSILSSMHNKLQLS